MLDASGLRSRIRIALAEFVPVPPDQIDESRDFAEYGLGSAEAALFIGALETIVGHDLPPLIVYDNSTVASLADAIVSQRVMAGK